jgi:hypothetical protein
MQETELVLIRNQLSTLVRFFTRIASFLRYWTDLHAGEAQQMIQDGSRDGCSQPTVFVERPEKRSLLMLTDDKEGVDENSSQSAEVQGPRTST